MGWFNRKKTCRHSFVKAASWNFVKSDTGGKSWDGAYCDFCILCNKQKGEIGNEEEWRGTYKLSLLDENGRPKGEWLTPEQFSDKYSYDAWGSPI